MNLGKMSIVIFFAFLFAHKILAMQSSEPAKMTIIKLWSVRSQEDSQRNIQEIEDITIHRNISFQVLGLSTLRLEMEKAHEHHPQPILSLEISRDGLIILVKYLRYIAQEIAKKTPLFTIAENISQILDDDHERCNKLNNFDPNKRAFISFLKSVHIYRFDLLKYAVNINNLTFQLNKEDRDVVSLFASLETEESESRIEKLNIILKKKQIIAGLKKQIEEYRNNVRERNQNNYAVRNKANESKNKGAEQIPHRPAPLRELPTPPLGAEPWNPTNDEFNDEGSNLPSLNDVLENPWNVW